MWWKGRKNCKAMDEFVLNNLRVPMEDIEYPVRYWAEGRAFLDVRGYQVLRVPKGGDAAEIVEAMERVLGAKSMAA